MWARAVRRGVPETKEHLGGRRGRAPHAPAALSRWPSPHTRQARRGAGWGLGLPGCESPSMQLTLPRLLQVQELGVPRRDCSRNGKNVQRHFWHFKGHRLAPSGCGLKPPHVHCLGFRAGLVRALVGRHVRSQQGLTLSARPSPRGTESWRPAPCALQCGVGAADTPEAAHPRAGAGRRIGPEHSRAGEARGGGPADRKGTTARPPTPRAGSKGAPLRPLSQHPLPDRDRWALKPTAPAWCVCVGACWAQSSAPAASNSPLKMWHSMTSLGSCFSK